jgi:hypothetical protein
MNPPVISALRLPAEPQFDAALREFRCIMPPPVTLQREAGGQHPNCNESLNSSAAEFRVDRATAATGSAMDQPERSNLTETQHVYSSQQEIEEERRKLRRLQIMMSMVMSVISQDADLSVEEASEMAANAKRAALAMFPDKEFAYDILYKPRLQRLMAERFHLQ